ncbi:MAG: rod shape-determining protein MreD [Candidatus Moraniibacteriota bacterium]
MNKKIIYGGLILLAIFFQLSFLPIFVGSKLLGDAVLMLVLALAVIDGFGLTLGWSVVAGALYDFASYATFGQHVIIFLLAVYVVSFFSRRLSVEVRGTGLLMFFLFIIIVTIISDAMLVAFFVFGGKSVRLFFQVFGNFGLVTFQVMCNSLLFFLWFNIIKKIKKKFL